MVYINKMNGVEEINLKNKMKIECLITKPLCYKNIVSEINFMEKLITWMILNNHFVV